MGASGGRNHYSFRTAWWVPAPPTRVFAVLERAESYPEWWPQVRRLARTGTESGTLRIRSVLPYELSVAMRLSRRDPAAGVLQIGMSGDLDGWARWTIRATGTGAVALFEQDVEVNKRLLRLLAIPGRPLFIANHKLMMRSGHRGLRALLERGLDEE
ncbi:SRPBCC family protein [Streptomyces sp. 891-h]|uniref:SRPBCC family protein n=1 Tax=unclassified Streptomyces TaxID=2593676 RepID=UPI001FA97538|nr:SRPBCC family protein [Streptomyces sp. 891-h]UNZ20356.1 polyketide cyclase [Streptomyces sp. 891-h]